MAMIAPALAGLGVSQHGFIQFALGTSICAAVGYAGGRAAARTARAKRPINAARSSQKMRHAAEKQRRPRLTHEITLAGHAVPLQDEAKHFKLIGTTGTGKSTAIQEIVHCALARGDRAVIADPDGRLYAAILRPGTRRCRTQSLRSAFGEMGLVRRN